MLPEQHDILWSYLTIMFSLFSLYVFINVIQHSRERETVNGKLWGSIFGAGFVLNMFLTVHMFDLVQADQMAFVPWQVLAVLITLLVWGMFFKNENIQNQSPPIIRGAFFWCTVSILLAGYSNWLPQQRSDPPPKAAAISDDITMEQFVDMGRVIVYGAKQVAGQKSIGKGQCPLCHTFDPADHMGRCPNLFGIGERAETRVKEDRYATSPVAIGETEPATGVVKGAPDQVDEAYRRSGSPDLIGEDYLRESLMCPSCYVVEGFGGDGDTKSPMPVISKPPISLTPVELNAVIAFLQSMDTPGDFSKVTVPLPTAQAEAPAEDSGSDEEAPTFVTGNEPVEEIINTLGCPLCHVIPGVEGALGALGPPLHEATNAPNRIKDPNYKGKATNTKEYVRESILDPSAFVVFNEEAGEPYADGLMPQDFKNKLSVQAIDKLVDFISQTKAEG
ncbi:MAG: cytochrome C [Candidatus Nitrohelix vancouverensis]|uniref:Cytochrome C n=1 Tax=Candidatus Nitrohelix vancouverensis TaxID=2705534 RepID=A0A7T0G3K7_9BACT|nr:MAG: cytochrome C [Candidatus Nitrohelix vancouverensis]